MKLGVFSVVIEGRKLETTLSETKLAENIELVRKEVLSSPDTSYSLRRLADRTGISFSSVYTILRNLKIKPYIPRLYQTLTEDDSD